MQCKMLTNITTIGTAKQTVSRKTSLSCGLSGRRSQWPAGSAELVICLPFTGDCHWQLLD